MPREVIMPALGMAQDTGQILAWHKKPGEAVARGDVLFEVETDKAAMEVEAQSGGYLTDVAAEAGSDVPVGEVIALISETPNGAGTVSDREAAQETPAGSSEPTSPLSTPETVRPAVPKAQEAHFQTLSNEKILASPKARRLAIARGLDLNHLAEAGYPQPFHVKDLEAFKALPLTQTNARSASAASRISVDLAEDGFADFAVWVAEQAGLRDERSLLAGYAAASLGRVPAAITVETALESQTFLVPSLWLGEVKNADPDCPTDLVIRDLRLRRISSVSLGAEPCPVLSIARKGTGLRLTLECGHDQLGANDALTFLDNFAGRMEQPLRHLL